MSITRDQFDQAKQEGASSSLDDVCPHTGLLARAWREGRRQMVAERQAAMMENARAV